jgi:hypothetical protein
MLAEMARAAATRVVPHLATGARRLESSDPNLCGSRRVPHFCVDSPCLAYSLRSTSNQGRRGEHPCRHEGVPLLAQSSRSRSVDHPKRARSSIVAVL